MTDRFSGPASVRSRIAQIESKISALAGGNAAGVSAPTFTQELERASTPAAAASGPATKPLSNGLPGLPPPPGWVGPMPVQPRPMAAGASGAVAQWEGLIQKYAGQYDVPAELVRAVIDQESSGDPRVVSRAGAMGLMQLMPANVREAGVSDPFDPEQNVRAGVAQLREHLDRYHGDVRLALAAYNAGPGNVAKYGGIPPFRETQNYVRKITARLGDG